MTLPNKALYILYGERMFKSKTVIIRSQLIAEQIGLDTCDKAALSAALKHMIGEGLVARPFHGHFSITSKGIAAIIEELSFIDRVLGIED